MPRTNFIRLLMLLVIALAVSLLIVNSGIQNTSAQTPQPPATAQPAEPTMEQKHKNIQALKGVPSSQLYPMMNLFNVALGVDCIFCHVKTGDKWEWDKDDKKHKQDARKMIQLTMELNKNYFNGRSQVSCNTCHRGDEHTVGIASLPLASYEPHKEEAQPQQSWPMPQQILDKYVQAVGGVEAVAKLNALVIKGSYITAKNQSFPMEMKIAGSDKWFWTMTLPNGEVQSSARNGATDWFTNNNENRPLTIVERNRYYSQAQAMELLQFKAPYPRLNFGGTEKIGDRTALILRGNLPDKRRVRYYFDAETGLLLRRIVYTDLVVGADPEQTDYEDYRVIEGVKIPFTIRTSYFDSYFTGTRKIREVKTNAKLSEADFAQPASK